MMTDVAVAHMSVVCALLLYCVLFLHIKAVVAFWLSFYPPGVLQAFGSIVVCVFVSSGYASSVCCCSD